MPALLAAPPDTLTIRPWPDKIIDTLGHDPRSSYVETFWLGVLGPSTTWLLRRLVSELEQEPAGFELSLSDAARAIGLGMKGGRHSPFVRALTRLVQFEVAQPHGRALLVRRKVPPLTRRQIERLPAALQAQHAALQQAELDRPPFEEMRMKTRRLALSLVEVGEDIQTTERNLLRWGYHPALAREAASWAWQRHRQQAVAESDDAA